MTTVEKVFQILEELSKCPLSFSGIQKKLSMPKSTAWSLLTQMESLGAIEKELSGQYRLTLWITRLGLSSLQQLNVRDLAEPIMRNMAEQTKEISHLSILERKNMEIVYIAKFEGPSSIHIKTAVGSSNPCYCTAGGKLLLAHLNDEEIQHYLENVPLHRYTENTIINKEALLKELKKIKEIGYSVDRGEHIEYSVGVSAPVFDHQGTCVAALSITGLSERMKEKEALWIQMVMKKAEELSKLMGF